jgi:hypothetical protein
VFLPSSKRPSATLSDSEQKSKEIWEESPEHATTSDETTPPESRPPPSAALPEPNKGTTESAQPVHPAPPAEKVNPKFFTDELKGRMKDYLVLGTVYGIYTGTMNAIQKEIQGTISPGAYVPISSLPLLPAFMTNILTYDLPQSNSSKI